MFALRGPLMCRNVLTVKRSLPFRLGGWQSRPVSL